MKRAFIIIIWMAVLALIGSWQLAVPSFAAQNDANLLAQANKKKRRKKSRVVYEKESTIRFDDGIVEGRIIKPDGFFLLRKRPKRWQDLVKARPHFKPELNNMKYEF